MSIQIGNRSIERVSIIDDEPDFRSELQTVISDGHMTAIPLTQSVVSLEEYFNSSLWQVDAVVTDHHLKKKANYFPINGAELSAEFYQRHIPTVLVTKVEQPDLEIRKFRRSIPIVLNPDYFEVDSFMHAVEICLKEFDRKFLPQRKAWRSLVNVEEMDNQVVYVTLPSWSNNEKIRISLSDFEPQVLEVLKPDKKLHAQVNTGAETSDELYFFDWEIE